MIRSALLFVSFALGPLLSGCSGKSCTDAGCTSSALISGALPSPSGPVTVEACRNGACTKLEAIAPEGCKNAGSAPQIQVCFIGASGALEIAVVVYEGVDAPRLEDGDVYTLDVTDDASGSSLVDFTATASYEDYRPNGADCPPVCRNAELAI